MAYTAPRTWVTNTAVTAAALNTDVRDNEIFLRNPPSARVFNSAAIAIANQTTTFLTFNSERFDTDNMHSTSSNSGRLIAVTAGRYLFGAHCQWEPNATGDRVMDIMLNGVDIIAVSVMGSAKTAGNHTRQFATGFWEFTANDYIEVRVWQDSTVSLNVDAQAKHSPEFWMAWQGGA